MNKFTIFLLAGVLGFPSYAQSPLNRIDTFYYEGEKEQAKEYAEAILSDAGQPDSEKKAIKAYFEIRTILADKNLTNKKKRDHLDQVLSLAEEAINSVPVCADAYYAKGLNRMFAANLVREFSSLNNITAAKDAFIAAYDLDQNHYGSLSELAGIYGYMPEIITFGDRNIAVNLSKQLYHIRGSRRDACQLAALLFRRDWSARKRNSNRSTATAAYRTAASPFEAAASFEGSGQTAVTENNPDDDRKEAESLCRKHSLTFEEISGETAWSRDF